MHFQKYENTCQAKLSINNVEFRTIIKVLSHLLKLKTINSWLYGLISNENYTKCPNSNGKIEGLYSKTGLSESEL